MTQCFSPKVKPFGLGHELGHENTECSVLLGKLVDVDGETKTLGLLAHFTLVISLLTVLDFTIYNAIPNVLLFFRNHQLIGTANLANMGDSTASHIP